DTRLVVPNDASLREALLTEAHSSPFSVHPGWQRFFNKRSYDYMVLHQRSYQTETHFSRLIFGKVCKRLGEPGLSSVKPFIPRQTVRVGERVIEGPEMIEVTNAKVSVSKEKLKEARTHGQTERTIQTLEDMLCSCALELIGNWDDYICLDQVEERVIEGPETIEVTNEKVVVAKEKLKEARTRQKSYADKHRRSIEFQPGDRVFLKVSPARGGRRFGIKGKLNPRFIGPFEILDRVGEISYRLALPPQLSHVHNVFHVSLLRGQISQSGMNMGQDRQMQMVGRNGENQFRQYAGQNVGNWNGYNAVQNVRNQVAQNPRVPNVG
nr:putative nucleotidyltransferase, ribonuclease H [Tanacetum cinerariifolium]